MSHLAQPDGPVDDAVAAGNPASLRRTLLALAASTALLVLMAAGGGLLHLRGEMIRDAEARAESAARVLEDHLLRTFRATELVLDRAVTLGRSRDMEDLAASRTTWEELVALRGGLAYPGPLSIIAADGRTALGTDAFPTQRRSVAGRDYFQAHVGRRHPLVIGAPTTDEGGGNPTFHLSKRIEDADGRLLGVAAAGFDAMAFADVHRSLGLGPRSSLSVLGVDGRVIMRQPASEAGAEGGSATAHRVVPPYGVAVICSVPLDEILADWRRIAAITGAVTAGVGLLLGVLVALAIRGLRRDVGLMADLEDRVRGSAEEARLLAAEARRANDAKTRFLAAASHDLRQPLQAAGMFAEALSARMAGSPHVPILDKLRQSVDATQALLSTLLDATTLEAGRVTANPVAFPLAPLMASLADQLEPEAAARGLSLRVVPTDAWVVSDPVLLERMLRNLLVNAFRYTETGGVLLGCRRRGARLAIQVVDTGCGIPHDQRNAVFEDFVRLGDKGSGPSRGLGLGLAVVRRMAALMGHDLEVVSTVGRGSVFGVVVARVQRRVSNGVGDGSASDLVTAENTRPSTSP